MSSAQLGSAADWWPMAGAESTRVDIVVIERRSGRTTSGCNWPLRRANKRVTDGVEKTNKPLPSLAAAANWPLAAFYEKRPFDRSVFCGCAQVGCTACVCGLV